MPPFELSLRNTPRTWILHDKKVLGTVCGQLSSSQPPPCCGQQRLSRLCDSGDDHCETCEYRRYAAEHSLPCLAAARHPAPALTVQNALAQTMHELRAACLASACRSCVMRGRSCPMLQVHVRGRCEATCSSKLFASDAAAGAPWRLCMCSVVSSCPPCSSRTSPQACILKQAP